MTISILVVALIFIISTFMIIGANNSNNKVKGSIIGGITGILLLLFFYGLASCSVQADNKIWNNGLCPSCGQHWEFKSATSSKGYIYSCDNCHTNIQLHFLK